MAGQQLEADVPQHDLVVKGQRDFVEHDRCVCIHAAVGHQYNRVINSLVTKKSTAITATDAATTDCVVARPTPCVPPCARRPTWHPMLTMTYPRQNGLMIPIHASSG